ncbi:MAG: hypothetical protein FD135_5514, partial [Comamonadaceae bacterium]
MNIVIPSLPEPDRSTVRSRSHPDWYLTQSERHRLYQAVTAHCPVFKHGPLAFLVSFVFSPDIVIYSYFHPLDLPLPACGPGIALVNARMRDKRVRIIPFAQAYRAACLARDMGILAGESQAVRELAFLAALLTPLDILVNAHPHYGCDSTDTEQRTHYLKTWRSTLLLKPINDLYRSDAVEMHLLARLLGFCAQGAYDEELLTRLQTAVSLATVTIKALWNPVTLPRMKGLESRA